MSATASQDLHRAYRALLLAFAYPGRPQALPAAGAPALDLLLEAVWQDASDQVRVGDGPDASALIESAPRGTPGEPEAGVTIIRVVAGDGQPTAVVLEGPGVNGTLAVTLPLSRAELAARARACADGPMGVELVLLERDGTLLCLPRTTRVREVD